MKIVAVSGGGSGSGKTSLVEAFLGALPGFGALKTSPGRDYELVIDPVRLLSSGTDTRRYLDGGAVRTAWLSARPPLDAGSVREVLAVFAGCAGLVIEGDSLADSFAPRRRYVIVRAGAPVKPAAREAMRRADGIVANVPRATPPKVLAALEDEIASAAGRRPDHVVDVARPEEPGLRRVVEEIRAWARC